MRIYTRTGDAGETSLLGGPRVSKDDLRIDVLGTIDELNALLGVAIAFSLDPQLGPIALDIQRQLLVVGAELARPSGTPRPVRNRHLEPEAVVLLENWIDQLESQLSPLRAFILPGGHPASAALHHARTVCRRAERLLVALARQHPVRPFVIVYFNRLSDFLFVAARYTNHVEGVPDVPWHSPTPP